MRSALRTNFSLQQKVSVGMTDFSDEEVETAHVNTSIESNEILASCSYVTASDHVTQVRKVNTLMMEADFSSKRPCERL